VADIERESLVYRPGVGMMLINGQHKILAGKRIGMPSDAWQMPQGGIDLGEDPEAAAWRTDDDFSLDLHEREFSEIQWLDRQTLVDRVVWFKRKSYLEMLAEFAPHFPD
jgi:hypothetical protein